MSFPDYKSHANIFINKISIHQIKDETSLYYAAEKYIKAESDFRYKDTVEIGTLLSILRDRGLIKFLGYNYNHAEKYILTEEGKHLFAK